jgi:hypothetical protein
MTLLRASVPIEVFPSPLLPVCWRHPAVPLDPVLIREIRRFYTCISHIKGNALGSTCINLLLSMEINGRAMVAWEAAHG